MANDWRKKVYSNPSKGINDSVSAVLLTDLEAAELINARVNQRFLLEKYPGYQKDGSPFPNNSDGFIRFLLNLRIGTSVDVLLMAAQDNANTNSTYKVDFKKTTGDGTYSYIGHTTGTATFTNGSTAVSGNGTTWLTQLKAGDKIKVTSQADTVYAEISSITNDTNLVLTANYTGASSGGNVAYIARIIFDKSSIPAGIVFNNKAIITNGYESPMTYNNTTLTRITSANAPKARYVEPHKNRAFMANTSGNPSRVFWSATNDEQTWDANSYQDIFPNDAASIVAIKSFADSLLVFKNNGKVYQVIGSFDQDSIGAPSFIRKIDIPENIGYIMERTAVNHNGYLYFLAETGVYRLDQRMGYERVTHRRLDNFISSINYNAAPNTAKTFNFTSSTEWSAGTANGMKYDTVNGGLVGVDKARLITDAYQGSGLAAIAIGSDNTIHAVYVDTNSVDKKSIKYLNWLDTPNDTNAGSSITAESTTIEDVMSLTITVKAVSIDVAPNGTVGIAAYGSGGPVKFIERIAGVWGTAQTVIASIADINSAGLSCKYKTTNDPVVLHPYSASVNYSTRSGSTWTNNSAGSGGGLDGAYSSMSLVLNGSNNPRIAYATWGTGTGVGASGRILALYSDNNGVAWTTVDTLTGQIGDNSYTTCLQVGLNAAGNIISGFIPSKGTNINKLVERNHTTTTTTVIYTPNTDYGNPIFTGYLYDQTLAADKKTWSVQRFGISGFLTTAWPHFGFYGVKTAAQTEIDGITFAYPNPATSYACGDKAFCNNGRYFANLAFGSNVNELRVTKIVFNGTYKTPQKSDSTLASWGTYSLTNGTYLEFGQVTHTLALSTISMGSDPLLDANYTQAVLDGQVISTDATKIFISSKIDYTLGWGIAPQISSLVLNYVGAGTDSKQPIGFSFDNELHYAVAKTTDSNNSYFIISDISDALLKTTYPVSAMERFKSSLYAGKSTKGDLLILKQGSSFDGSAYSLDCQLKEDFLDAVELTKDFYKAYVLYEVKPASSLIISYRLDSFATNGGSTWTNNTIDATKDGFAEISIGKTGRSIQFRAQDTTSGDQTGLICIVLVYRLLNIR